MSTPRVLVPLAEGFEEIEAITIVDTLRRAGVEVVTAALREGPVLASRRTRHLADCTMDGIGAELYDMVALPGGQPGTNHLKADVRLRDCVVRHVRSGRWVAAICAAPIVLQELGFLHGRQVTSHPSVREELEGCCYEESRVVVDGKLVTSRGPGTALEFSLCLVALLSGRAKAEELAGAMVAGSEWAQPFQKEPR